MTEQKIPTAQDLAEALRAGLTAPVGEWSCGELYWTDVIEFAARRLEHNVLLMSGLDERFADDVTRAVSEATGVPAVAVPAGTHVTAIEPTEETVAYFMRRGSEETRGDLREVAERLHEVTGKLVFWTDDGDLRSVSEEEMREAGWVRAEDAPVPWAADSSASTVRRFEALIHLHEGFGEERPIPTQDEVTDAIHAAVVQGLWNFNGQTRVREAGAKEQGRVLTEKEGPRTTETAVAEYLEAMAARLDSSPGVQTWQSAALREAAEVVRGQAGGGGTSDEAEPLEPGTHWEHFLGGLSLRIGEKGEAWLISVYPPDAEPCRYSIGRADAEYLADLLSRWAKTWPKWGPPEADGPSETIWPECPQCGKHATVHDTGQELFTCPEGHSWPAPVAADTEPPETAEVSVPVVKVTVPAEHADMDHEVDAYLQDDGTVIAKCSCGQWGTDSGGPVREKPKPLRTRWGCQCCTHVVELTEDGRYPDHEFMAGVKCAWSGKPAGGGDRRASGRPG